MMSFILHVLAIVRCFGSALVQTLPGGGRLLRSAAPANIDAARCDCSISLMLIFRWYGNAWSAMTPARTRHRQHRSVGVPSQMSLIHNDAARRSRLIDTNQRRAAVAGRIGKDRSGVAMQT